MKKNLLALGIAASLILGGCGRNGNPVMITAHRGDQSAAPENTLSAFEAAIENGADYVELDVTETKDGILVILHDDSLMRTTGLEKNIWDVTYEETQKLDAGSWYSGEFAGERIPTLEEVIRLCKGKIKMNIEIKVTGHESKEFVEKIVALIQKEELSNQCIVTSFDYDTVRMVKELDSSLQAGPILSGKEQNLENYQDMDLFSISGKILTKDMVEEAHKMGKPVHVWTVNDKSKIKKFWRMGVDNIITNDPGLVRKIVE